jgi:hypothetical protein
MQNAGLAAAAGTLIVLTAALATKGRAQPFPPNSLADKGNAAWASGRCLDAAMNYYALLQQPPSVIGNSASLLRSRIQQCRAALARLGTGGIDGKADQPSRPIDGDGRPVTLPPQSDTGDTGGPAVKDDSSLAPRPRACRAYAQTAVAQTRLLAARNCGGSGLRMSTFEFHYQWCTERGTPERAQAFANQRAQELNACLLRW